MLFEQCEFAFDNKTISFESQNKLRSIVRKHGASTNILITNSTTHFVLGGSHLLEKRELDILHLRVSSLKNSSKLFVVWETFILSSVELNKREDEFLHSVFQTEQVMEKVMEKEEEEEEEEKVEEEGEKVNSTSSPYPLEEEKENYFSEALKAFEIEEKKIKGTIDRKELRKNKKTVVEQNRAQNAEKGRIFSAHVRKEVKLEKEKRRQEKQVLKGKKLFVGRVIFSDLRKIEGPAKEKERKERELIKERKRVLRDVFNSFGEVVNITEETIEKGYFFVAYQSRSEAILALNALSKFEERKNRCEFFSEDLADKRAAPDPSFSVAWPNDEKDYTPNLLSVSSLQKSHRTVEKYCDVLLKGILPPPLVRPLRARTPTSAKKAKH